jgi:hypothetical protein
MVSYLLGENQKRLKPLMAPYTLRPLIDFAALVCPVFRSDRISRPIDDEAFKKPEVGLALAQGGQVDLVSQLLQPMPEILSYIVIKQLFAAPEICLYKASLQVHLDRVSEEQSRCPRQAR